MNTLLRQAERVRVGCLAQIVNVIAPLVTNETSVLRQSIYYPYAWALKYARGRVLDLLVESETYPIQAAGLRPDFARDDAGAVRRRGRDPRPAERAALPVHAEPRPRRRSASWSLDWRDFTPTRVLACETLTGADLKAANTFERPTLVAPRPLEAPRPGATMTFKLPAALLQRRAHRHVLRACS